jgi:hypothetical protein
MLLGGAGIASPPGRCYQNVDEIRENVVISMSSSHTLHAEHSKNKMLENLASSCTIKILGVKFEEQ